MIKKAYVRFKEDHPENENMFCAWTGFKDIGIKTEPFWGFGDLETFKDIGKDVLVSGYIYDVEWALKSLGVVLPGPLDYPEELVEYLGRKIVKTTLGTLRYHPYDACFIKPVQRKIFTGFLWPKNRTHAAVCDDDVEVWQSELVDFVSEYRCFILHRELLDMRFYKGDPFIAPNKQIVLDAIKKFESSPETYILDFGVTSDGKTLLVEVNEAQSFGTYGLKAENCARIIEANWEELTRKLPQQ